MPMHESQPTCDASTPLGAPSGSKVHGSCDKNDTVALPQCYQRQRTSREQEPLSVFSRVCGTGETGTRCALDKLPV